MSITLPNGTGNILLDWYISTAGFSAPNWVSLNSLNILNGATSHLVNIFSKGVAASVVSTSSSGAEPGLVTATTALAANYIWIVAYLDGSSGTLVKYNNSTPITVTSVNVVIGSTNVNYNQNGPNKLYLIFVDYIDQVAFVIDLNTRGQVFTEISTAAPTASTLLTILSGGTTAGIAEVFSYLTLTDFQSVYNYIFAKYGGFLLPLTFPANSIPQLNPV